VLEGAAGEEKIKEIIEYFRENKPTSMCGLRMFKVEDYLTQVRYYDKHQDDILLPRSNVLKFVLEDGSWFVLRPSGTEPKLKIYIGVMGDSLASSEAKNKELKEAVLEIIERI
jgi:phosphoglucomutase